MALIETCFSLQDTLFDAEKRANRSMLTMRKAELDYRQIFECLGGAVFLADERSGEIIDINRRAETMLCCERSEIVGRRQSHFLPSLDQGPNFAESVESELIRPDGSPLPVLINSLRLTVHDRPIVLRLCEEFTPAESQMAGLIDDGASHHVGEIKYIKMNVNVMLVEDHPMMRKGLRQAISKQPHLTLVGEAASGEVAVELAQELRPDLVIIGIHLLAMNGIEATRQILKALPDTKILVFSTESVVARVDEALQAGVHGFILKLRPVADLLHAIDEVMAGRLCLSPELSAAIVEDHQRKLARKLEPSKSILLPREKQLLRLISEGRRNKEIAPELKLSVNSIETYRARLMKKVGCASTAELVRYAIREGIATL